MILRALLVLLLGIAPIASSSAAEPEADLLAQARHWQERGRPDLAETAWNKLLVINPEHPEALAGLGERAAQRGDQAAARDYLQRLRKVAPTHPGVARITHALSAPTLDAELLKRARERAAAQRYEEAAETYRLLFEGRQPEGALALEYYQTLGATENGWEAAREGLTRLAREHRNDPSYALALAKHLTYREPSRREGIRMLSGMRGAEAEKAWRDALLWLNATPADIPLYQSYQQRVGADPQVDAKLAQLRQWQQDTQRRQQPQQAPTLSEADRRLQQGYEALDDGALASAEEHFQRVLALRARNADALAGLGLVRLRQQRFGEAERLLADASRAAPRRAKQWESALRSARYWHTLERAAAAERADRADEAERELRKAIALDEREPTARLRLAGLLAQRGDYQAAEQLYRALLRERPQHADALQGLFETLAAQGKDDEALALIEEHGSTPGLSRRVGKLQARVLRRQAEQASDVDERLALYQRALALDPEDPWIRLELAKLHLQRGDEREAHELIDSLLLTHPDMADALHAKALLAAESGQWWDGLQALERIAPAERTEPMRQLQHRLWLQYQTQRVGILVRNGQPHAAQAVLQELKQAVGNRPEERAMVAQAMADAGDLASAMGLLRQALAEGGPDSAAIRLQYAGLLLRSGQEAEARLQLQQLRFDSQRLNERQRQTMDELAQALALRDAARARERGDLAAAYEFLAPWLERQPPQPSVLQELAALYQKAGDQAQALDLYRQVLAEQPDNVDAITGAAGAAMELGEHDYVQNLLDNALRRQPDDARLYALRGRLARARGADRQAMQDLNKALALGARSANGDARSGAGLLLIERGGGAYLPPRQLAGAAPRAVAATAAPAGDRTVASGERPAAPVAGANPFAPPQPVPGDDANAWQEEVRQQIAEIESERGSTFRVGPAVRFRDGRTGLDSLTELGLALEASLNIGYVGRLSLSANPVWIDAGQVSGSSVDTAMRFGALALDLDRFDGRRYGQDATGVGLQLAYEQQDWRFDLGSTPFGFPQVYAVGGVRWAPRFGDTELMVSLSRRAVTDSVLSYAGTRDPLTGRSWGGVHRTGAAARLVQDFDRFGVYGSLGYYRLAGDDVEDNRQFELGTGFYWKLWRRPDQEFTLGLNLTYFQYRENLRHFTLGHGGYFSPQRFVAVTVPAELTGRYQRLSYRLGIDAGLQHFQEDAADLFPGDRALQAGLEAAAADDPRLITGYAGQSSTGLGFNGLVELEYQLSTRLALGGALRYSNARDYDELSLLLFLSYYFDRSYPSVLFPPQVLTPYPWETGR